MQQNPNALPNGTFLQSGKYHILETIGSGGFGITYLVENRHTKQQQVIKELFLSVSGMTCTREGTNLVFYTTNPKFQFSRFKENFRKEAGVLLKLKKVTGVVNVIAIFEENDTIYFAMDWIDGQNLQQWTSEKNDRSSPYYIEQCVVWAMNAAFIVHGVHREGVLHRDIKPQNMMVVPKTGQLVLIDFGIARDFVEGETQTQTAMQSPGYSPPEQWELKAQRGAYTDVYSLGATLYFLLTGRTPPENSDQRIVRKGLDGGWEPIHFNKNIPEGLNAIIIHAMQP
ncbi:MAG: hypothetical protein RI894_2032, partial [Bacteroidota bacterium]